MKKIVLVLTLLLSFLAVSCSKGKTAEGNATVIYKSETGDVEVPKDPQRIVVLNGAVSGSVISLKGNIIGVDKWSKMNPMYETYLKDVKEVSDENLEQIIELNPDLIITASTDKNIEKLKKIAPTISYTYGKVDYLTQILEIGKLIGKEKEATEWMKTYKEKVTELGKGIEEKYGKNITVTVVESFEKQLYIFGKNFARGTEILYTELGLNMPENVKEKVEKDGYYSISPEVLDKYAGDFLIFSKDPNADNSFQKNKTYNSLKAVKENKVFEINAKQFYFTDPITLDYSLEFFKEKFLQ